MCIFNAFLLSSCFRCKVKKLGITFGALPTHEFSGEIEANGKLAVAPQSQASVSPYTGGNVKQILVREGQQVTDRKSVV